MSTLKIPTYARRMNTAIDPLAAFRALTKDGAVEGSVLFETADEGSASSRSLILTRAALLLHVDRSTARVVTPDDAATPTGALETLRDALGELGEVRPIARGVEVVFPRVASSDEPRLDAPAFEVLRRFSTAFAPSRNDLDLYCLGAFAFELIDHVESLPALEREGDDIYFALPQELLVIDHVSRTATIVEYDFAGLGEFSCGRRIAEVEAMLANVSSTTGQPLPATTASGGYFAASQPAQGALPENEPQVPTTDIDDQSFGGLVEQARRHIVDGDIFQVVLSRAFQTPCPAPIAAYETLREMNPSPYMFYFGGEDVLFGASPETSLRVTGDLVEIRPIAGTRRRGRRADGSIDHDLDTRIEAELRLDAKEVAEHMMLVDLARNDVSRVSDAGSRRVDRLMGVDRYSTVMHLVSHVSGRLRPEYDALHAYAAAMNMGTLTGAPKIRATEILRQLEGQARGFYGGAVGYLTHRGDFDTAIVIRSATVRNGIAEVRAGAGIVHDSNPAAEAEETRRKANAVLNAIAATQQEVAP